MNRTAWLSAVAFSASLCTGALAQVSGTVKLDGPAPKRMPVPGLSANAQCAAMHKQPLLDESIVADKDGNLNNVVIFLRGANVKGEAPKDPVMLDQVACQYVPHVVTATVGQKIVALNDDAFLHNVHTLPEDSVPTNIAMPGKDRTGVALKPISSPEIVKTKCDVHPWMSAWIAVFDHPFHTVTGEDGAYELDVKGLADGEYEIVAWQEKFKEHPTPQKVTIKAGKAEKPVDFTFKQKAAAAGKGGMPESEVTLASLKGTVPVAAEGKACEHCEAGKAAVAAKAAAAAAAVAK